MNSNAHLCNDSLRSTILKLDQQYLWHPYTSSERRCKQHDLVIASAKGAYIYDMDGRRYLDASGSWWTNSLGYSHPRLVRALQEQALHLAHVSLGGTTHQKAAELAEHLVKVMVKKSW